MKNLFRSTKKKGYSLVEIVISLGIVALCTVIMLNFLIVSFRITTIGLARSYVREELANVINLVSRDFKAADFAPYCTTTGNNSSNCVFYIDGIQYSWASCDTKICRYRFDTVANSNIVVYSTPESIIITYFNFELGFSNSITSQSSNIILTISASHTNDSLGVNNIIKQASFSIRNYVL